MNKRELVEKSLADIKDIESKSHYEIILELKKWGRYNLVGNFINLKKCTKKERLFQVVTSHMRKKPSLKNEPGLWCLDLSLNNIQSLKVIVS